MTTAAWCSVLAAALLLVACASNPPTRALPGIIKGLRDKGFELVKVSQLLTDGPAA